MWWTTQLKKRKFFYRWHLTDFEPGMMTVHGRKCHSNHGILALLEPEEQREIQIDFNALTAQNTFENLLEENDRIVES